MNGKEWIKLLDKMQSISAFCSISANILLIFLIITKSPKEIGAYKYLMCYISTFEIFYSIIDSILSPFHHSVGTALLVLVSTKNRKISGSVLTFINSLYWACFGTSLLIFALHFIYRFLVFSGNPIVKSFQSWKLFFWLMAPLIFGTTWGLVGIFTCGPTYYFTNFIKNNVNETFGLDTNEFVYLGLYVYEKSPKNEITIHLKPLLGILIIFVSLGVSFFIVIYLGIKCYGFIKNVMQISTSSKFTILQSQLYYALVVQTVIPVFLMHIPVGIVLSLTLLDVNIGMLSGVLSMTIALYPAIDPLPNMFIIKNYRNALYGWLDFLIKRIKPTAREENSKNTPIPQNYFGNPI